MTIVQGSEQVDDSDMSDLDSESVLTMLPASDRPVSTASGRRPSPTVMTPRSAPSKSFRRVSKQDTHHVVQVSSLPSGETELKGGSAQISDSEESEDDDYEAKKAWKKAGVSLNQRQPKRQRLLTDQETIREQQQKKYRSRGAIPSEYEFQQNMINHQRQAIAAQLASQQHALLQSLAPPPGVCVFSLDLNELPSVPPLPSSSASVTIIDGSIGSLAVHTGTDSFAPSPYQPFWFSEDQVSPQELRHFSSLFPMDEEKYARMYFDLRNEIIKLYKFKLKLSRQSGQKGEAYLSSQECRTNMHSDDDAALLFESWRWLDKHKIINYSVGEYQQPVRVSNRSSSTAKSGWKAGGGLIDAAPVVAPVPLKHRELFDRVYNSPGVSWEALESEFNNPVIDLLTLPLIEDQQMQASTRVSARDRSASPSLQSLSHRQEAYQRDGDVPAVIVEVLKILRDYRDVNPVKDISHFTAPVVVEEGRARTGAQAESLVNAVYIPPPVTELKTYPGLDAHWLYDAVSRIANQAATVVERLDTDMEDADVKYDVEKDLVMVMLREMSKAAFMSHQELSKYAHTIFEALATLMSKRLEAKGDLFDTMVNVIDSEVDLKQQRLQQMLKVPHEKTNKLVSKRSSVTDSEKLELYSNIVTIKQL